MTELRLDPTIRNWVISAPERSKRPDAFRRPRRERAAGNDTCPFCPGREAETPAELFRLPGANGGWRLRVVPNKFAALSAGGSRDQQANGLGFTSMPGTGRHEVVIESPVHDWDLATADEREVRDVLTVYRARHRALRDASAAMVVIFRNHGAGGGTSLPHPHSQVVAAPVVPLLVRHRFDVAMQHYDDTGLCLYVEILHRELADGRRIVAQNDNFVAFQPFATASPFETWLMPRTHRASFADTGDDELAQLAALLRYVLGGLWELLDDPDYNYVIQSAPPGDEDKPYFLWHMQIVPKLTTPAGFELGSGISINPSSPEATAAALREAIAAREPV
jgi:UDPglucose--hexose-1-phosphate uridylyltransferase